MGMIVDSCLFISAERKRFELKAFSRQNDTDAFMFAVTWSELLKGLHRATTEVIREGRRRFVDGLLVDFPLIDFGKREAETHAEVVATLASKGVNLGAYDSMIAATALAHDWSVATLNLADFQRIPGLKVVDATPWLVK
jgi:tRNA(fMet)-specific endonuclease VapC